MTPKYLVKEVKKELAQEIRTRKKLGEILVEKGIITSLTVERILPLCAKADKRFGTILEEIGLVTSSELAQALAIQYGFNIVSDFAKYNFSEEVLSWIPVETAVELVVFPLKVQNNILALAVNDPTNQKVIANLGANSKIRIQQFIATRKDINRAIAKHYLHKELIEHHDNTVLIVEENKAMLNMLKNMLNKDYHVLTASDGMEAYKAIIAKKPKVVLADKDMSKFSCYALLDSLKNIPEINRIPLILISQSTDPDEEAAAYEKGFFDYIAKPVRETTLKVKIKRALRTHSHLIAFHA